MEAVWNAVKAAIKERVPGHSYRMWIEPIKPHEGEAESLVLACPNFFSKKRVQENFGSLIAAELEKALGRSCDVTIVVENGNCRKPTDDANMQLSLHEVNVRPYSGRMLRRDFTFDHFVVGGNNDFAYTASLSLAARKQSMQNCPFPDRPVLVSDVLNTSPLPSR